MSTNDDFKPFPFSINISLTDFKGRLWKINYTEYFLIVFANMKFAQVAPLRLNLNLYINRYLNSNTLLRTLISSLKVFKKN
jgi:hypothetical protein